MDAIVRYMPSKLALGLLLRVASRCYSVLRLGCFQQIKAASKTAGTATASVGKFDKAARGEKPADRTTGKRKQRSSLFDPKEGGKVNSLVDRIIRERR